MISIKTFAFIIILLEIVLLTTLVVIAIINKFKRNSYILFILDVLMGLILVIFTLGTKGNMYVSGGDKHSNIESIDYYLTDGGYYRVKLDNGTVYNLPLYIKGNETCVVEDGIIIIDSVIGLKVYSKGNMLVIKTKDVNYDNMSESEKKSLLNKMN